MPRAPSGNRSLVGRWLAGGDLYVLDGASKTDAGVSVMNWLAAHAEEGWEEFVNDFDD
jgi:hypothetical protein